jgi:hypothetical protein
VRWGYDDNRMKTANIASACPSRTEDRSPNPTFVLYELVVNILRQSRRLYGCWPLKGAFSQPLESNRKK